MNAQNTESLIIDETNFAEHFFDARKHKPKHGQVLAIYRAHAVFCRGPEKLEIIKMLRNGNAETAAQIMHKVHCAEYSKAFDICLEMTTDLLNGMSDDEVLDKEYEFVVEIMYYTDPNNVPEDDPHWSRINLIRFDNETGRYQNY